MRKILKRKEIHYTGRVGWLRAAVLGANDGIISTSALLAGVAASGASKNVIIMTGVAALASGALSMAAGEYVSVNSQLDTEKADIKREKEELELYPTAEFNELKDIYIKRGLDEDLAENVTRELMKKNPLKAHERDELGINENTVAKPIQAAIASAITFSLGAFLPLLTVIISPLEYMFWLLLASSLVFLAILGVVGARAGGASVFKGVTRVVFWGAAALMATAIIGKVFGTGF